MAQVTKVIIVENASILEPYQHLRGAITAAADDNDADDYDYDDADDYDYDHDDADDYDYDHDDYNQSISNVAGKPAAAAPAACAAATTLSA